MACVLSAIFATILIFLFSCYSLDGIRVFPANVLEKEEDRPSLLPLYQEAPEFRNGGGCSVANSTGDVCDPEVVHVAMTLDLAYLRGSMAAVLSVIKHADCPENVFFHFVTTDAAGKPSFDLLIRSTFPSLRFMIYFFDESVVTGLISSSVREALENPLNYARNYLGELLEPCVSRVIYLDSDLVLVDDIWRLWSINLTGVRAIGAPEYCHANFTSYFTERFWSNPKMGERVFAGRVPCYFNTGVMVVDLDRWRRGRYRERIEQWMEVQRAERIYDLGSLPPFLLVFAGDVEAVEHRWNQHGLGGDNVMGSCRSLHRGPVSLLHWSGKGKPWVRIDAKNPCPVDSLWEPYDLHIPLPS